MVNALCIKPIAHYSLGSAFQKKLNTVDNVNPENRTVTWKKIKGSYDRFTISRMLKCIYMLF